MDTWACSPGECSDDQLSVSTAQDEVTKNGNGGRHCKDRELPETPCSNFKDYDNTSPANITDVSPYEEISEVINQTREHLDLNSEPGSEQEAKASAVEALYSKVRKPRSNSIGRCSSLTGRTSPWAGRRTLSSRRSSFSHTESPLCSRRQLMPPNGRFWSSSSLQSVVNTQMCRLEHVEVNLTADNQGFGLTIAESCVGRQSVLVIAEIECGGPAER